MDRPGPNYESRRRPSQGSESEFNPDLTPLQRQGELARDVYEGWYDAASPEERSRRANAPQAIESYYRFLVVTDQRRESEGAEPAAPDVATKDGRSGESQWSQRAVESALDDLCIDAEAEVGPDELAAVVAALGVAAGIAERIFGERPDSSELPPRPFTGSATLKNMIALGQRVRRRRQENSRRFGS